MNILVVGCGSIGERHTRNVLSLGARAAVVEPRQQRREEIAAKYGVNTYPDAAQAYAAETFQAVLVTNPPHLHLATAREAVERGLDIFIEKPFLHSLEGAEDLVRAAEEKQLVSLVGCNLRFLTSMQKAAEIVRSGKLGTITAARIQCGFYLPSWRPHQPYTENYGARIETGGGAILDVIHEFDYAYWLFGEVEKVACFAARRSHLDIETEDTAAALLRFRSGVIGEIHVDYVQRSYSRGFEIIGDQGTLKWAFTGQKVSLFTADTKEWQEFEYPQDVNEMYVAELQHFLDCIATRQATVCPFRQALCVLEIALAAKRSAQAEALIAL